MRAAWFEAADAANAQTVLAMRPDGSAVAAIPIAGIGPPLVGTRAVPGSYWPFRSIAVAADALPAELEALLSAPQVRRALSPVWRVGPVLREDRAVTMLEQAAVRAGWTVLVRTLGNTFVLSVGDQITGGGWPRKSTLRRLKNYERQLAQKGELDIRFVTGSAWDEEAFKALAAIEANSWVGRRSDGSGAQFLAPAQCALWRRAVRDPHIAEALSATILTVGGEPAAFSFDLRAGERQYSIASSYDERFAAGRPGKIVTYRQLEWAARQGVQTVDLGVGDSGYKREMGAVAGSQMIDLLFVRNRSIGRLLSFKWGPMSELACPDFRASADARRRRKRIVAQVAAAAAIAATAVAASTGCATRGTAQTPTR
ncbi:Acetyltransferase (GNAT) domain-containing protein [Sphingomonas jatrophae]|uniref:Acetyltransferase (GNAT) domain-containing protein n=2 Tax=Sphingomonas jatrophae TaxID=1166337 RepID=A0A1I6K9R0_9SPHN|nr:Acetyltransferase (GNAT) domain-containing protein [Sphingomonas jatrophae]